MVFAGPAIAPGLTHQPRPASTWKNRRSANLLRCLGKKLTELASAQRVEPGCFQNLAKGGHLQSCLEPLFVVISGLRTG